MKGQRQSSDEDLVQKPDAAEGIPGKTTRVQGAQGTQPGIGKTSLTSSITPLPPGAQHLVTDGTQVEAEMQRTLAMIAARRASSDAGPSTSQPPKVAEGSGSHQVPDASNDEALEAQLEQTLAGLKRSLAQMGEHLQEALGEADPSGKGKEVVRAPSPEVEGDGTEAFEQLKASLGRMRQTLGLPAEAEAESAEDHAAHPATETEPAPVTTRPPAPTRPPPPIPTVGAAPPDRLPPAPTTATAAAPNNAAAPNYDLAKRVFKAASYGAAAFGTGASFAGWVALHWIGPRLQQTAQTAGGMAKNVVGAAGDYFDMKAKDQKADREAAAAGLSPEERTAARAKATNGMVYKVGGQLVSAIGQAISISGLFAPGSGVTRPIGASVNGLGMLIVAYGELGQGNKHKAAANFAGAVCNFIGTAGFAWSPKSESKVSKDIVEALLDVGSDSNAWTPIGGAIDDSAKSKAPGNSNWQKLQNDAKPGGQAITGVGAWLNFVASVLSRRSDSRLAEGDAEAAGALKIASIAIGGAANLVSSYGNMQTARGEAFPVTGATQPRNDEERQNDEQGIALNTLAPAHAT